MILVLIVSSSVAWFVPISKDGIVQNVSTFELKGGSSIQIDQNGEISNIISLNNLVLAEASSVDGRNLYFPVTTAGSINATATGTKLFRQATVGDQNVNYVYKTFTLTAKQDRTSVYINNYTIKVGDKTYTPSSINDSAECPVRIAFIRDSAEKPDVFDPTALAVNSVKKYKAVQSANYDTGSVALQNESTADPFSLYHYISGSPLVTLSSNDAVEMTMVVWLEGSENSIGNTSASNNFSGQEFSLEIVLESNAVPQTPITFVDKRNAIGSNNLVLNYTFDGKQYGVVMTDSSFDSANKTYAWVAPVPKGAKNINFTTHNAKGQKINTYSDNASFAINEQGEITKPIFVLDGTKQSWTNELNDASYTTFKLSISDRTANNWIYDSFAHGRNRVYAVIEDNNKEQRVLLYCDTAESALRQGTEFLFKSSNVVVKNADNLQITKFEVYDLYGNLVKQIGHPEHLSTITPNYNFEYLVLSDLREDGTNVVISKIRDEDESTASTGSTDNGNIEEEIPGTTSSDDNKVDESENTAGTDGDVGEEIP